MGMQQLVENHKSNLSRNEIVVMDEPTSLPLSQGEVILFGIIHASEKHGIFIFLTDWKNYLQLQTE